MGSGLFSVSASKIIDKYAAVCETHSKVDNNIQYYG